VIRRAVIACVAAAALAGCAKPLPDAELPETPIAFVYWTLAQGRDRAERMGAEPAEAPGSGEGVMDLNAMDDLIDRLRGVRRMPPDLQGRLAFYHPRTRSIEVLDAFVPGAVPCSFSAGHDRLLVATRRRGVPRLFQYSLDRRDVAPAVSGHGLQLDGSYGPGGRIAFAGSERVSERLRLSAWVTEEGGTAPKRLTAGPHDTRVAWSPDGRTLLVQSPGRNEREIIRAFDLRSSEPVPRLVARGREPAFSPLGDWVVYSREVDGGWRLWRMRPDGTGKTAVGHRPQGEADERHPTISPDGRYVAYVAERDGRQRIRIRGMDGFGDRLLIEDADGTQPVW
jgi:hypothetical protein